MIFFFARSAKNQDVLPMIKILEGWDRHKNTPLTLSSYLELFVTIQKAHISILDTILTKTRYLDRVFWIVDGNSDN